MGSQMSSKYSGKCLICKNAWNVGEQMFYQKEPKCMCNDKECFEKQGGKLYEPFQTEKRSSPKSELKIDKISLADMAKTIERWTKIADQETLEFYAFRKRVVEHGGSDIVAGMLYKTACDRIR
jgi:hypothetical protein